MSENAHLQCPACGDAAWTRYGCASCGEQPYPPSHDYQDAVSAQPADPSDAALRLSAADLRRFRVIGVSNITDFPHPAENIRRTTPVHDEIVSWLLDYLRQVPDMEFIEEFPIPAKDPLTAPSVDVYAPSHKLAFEVKSTVPSCGELLRQIRRYEAALPWCKCPVYYGKKIHSPEEFYTVVHGNAMGLFPEFDTRSFAHSRPKFVVVSPDVRYLSRITGAGYLFLEYPSAVWHEAAE